MAREKRSKASASASPLPAARLFSRVRKSRLRVARPGAVQQVVGLAGVAGHRLASSPFIRQRRSDVHRAGVSLSGGRRTRITFGREESHGEREPQR
jgi:hypothetical protein